MFFLRSHLPWVGGGLWVFIWLVCWLVWFSLYFVLLCFETFFFLVGTPRTCQLSYAGWPGIPWDSGVSISPEWITHLCHHTWLFHLVTGGGHALILTLVWHTLYQLSYSPSLLTPGPSIARFPLYLYPYSQSNLLLTSLAVTKSCPCASSWTGYLRLGYLPILN